MRLTRFTGRRSRARSTDAATAQDAAPSPEPPDGALDSTAREDVAPADPTTDPTGAADEPRPGERPAGKTESGRDGAVRHRLASVVWLTAAVCALFLAVGALFVALDLYRQNDLVRLVLTTADRLDLGTWQDFTGRGAASRSALTNWGIAAVVYLVVGKILDSIIRPRDRRHRV